MRSASSTHLVLIPSYNTGAVLLETVREARRHWEPVWVVIDGSTDGSGETLARMASEDRGLRVFIRTRNEGKGAAILHGLAEASARGFTHVLTMDADGQHPGAEIPGFMQVSQANPGAVVLGVPIFDTDAPALRVHGRKVSNSFADFETLWSGIGDSLFGFRVYPISDLLAVMSSTRWMRRFDFEPEAAVRLCWRGLPLINRRTPVKYLRPEDGGVSHFHYLRDNALLTWMHLRLLGAFLFRLPRLVGRKLRSCRH